MSPHNSSNCKIQWKVINLKNSIFYRWPEKSFQQQIVCEENATSKCTLISGAQLGGQRLLVLELRKREMVGNTDFTAGKKPLLSWDRGQRRWTAGARRSALRVVVAWALHGSHGAADALIALAHQPVATLAVKIVGASALLIWALRTARYKFIRSQKEKNILSNVNLSFSHTW